MEVGIFVSPEKEQLILNNRAAKCPPATVVVVWRLPRNSWSVTQNCCLSQIVERIKIPVLRIPLARTVVSIGAALGHQVKLASSGVPVFGAELVRLQSKLVY